MPVQDAVDHRGHQARLRRGGFVAADALHPLNFDLVRRIVVEIFAVGNNAGADGVDQYIRFSLVCIILRFDLGARRQICGIDSNLDGFVLRQTDVHQLKRSAHRENRGHGANNQSDLLLGRRGAYEKSRFQIL